jgi:hypothetical protein
LEFVGELESRQEKCKAGKQANDYETNGLFAERSM